MQRNLISDRPYHTIGHAYGTKLCLSVLQVLWLNGLAMILLVKMMRSSYKLSI